MEAGAFVNGGCCGRAGGTSESQSTGVLALSQGPFAGLLTGGHTLTSAPMMYCISICANSPTAIHALYLVVRMAKRKYQNKHITRPKVAMLIQESFYSILSMMPTCLSVCHQQGHVPMLELELELGTVIPDGANDLLVG